MDARTQGFMNALAQQRNAALDALANAEAELAARGEKIAELEKQLADQAQAAQPGA
jgi:hypothetical protein